MNELNHVVREQCYYQALEPESEIEERIEETKVRARAVAAQIGIVQPHVTEIYAPYYASMEAPCNPPCKTVYNWRGALDQSFYEVPIGTYTMIICDQEYLDRLPKRVKR